MRNRNDGGLAQLLEAAVQTNLIYYRREKKKRLESKQKKVAHLQKNPNPFCRILYNYLLNGTIIVGINTHPPTFDVLLW